MAEVIGTEVFEEWFLALDEADTRRDALAAIPRRPGGGGVEEEERRQEAMKTKSWKEIRARKITTPEREARVRRRVEEALVKMDLREVRSLVGATQTSLAKQAKMAQGEVSRVERGRDHLVSTLRRYVKALGGELEITARFGDRRVRLRAAD